MWTQLTSITSLPCVYSVFQGTWRDKPGRMWMPRKQASFGWASGSMARSANRTKYEYHDAHKLLSHDSPPAADAVFK